MKIYAEWKIKNNFYSEFFYNWGAFYNATFSPLCEILQIIEIKEDKKGRTNWCK